MNRRHFFHATVGVASFGFIKRDAHAGARFGVDAAPEGFPEYNWVDLPSPISDGIIPWRGDVLVGGNDGIYRVSGLHGPFKVTKDARGCPCRLWAMHVDPDIACVTIWHR